MKNVNECIINKNQTEKSFSMIPKSILMNKELSSDAMRLLILMLDNSQEWILNTTFYANLMGWESKKLSRLTKELITLGYVVRTKKCLGRQKGFQYIYQVFNYIPFKEDTCKDNTCKHDTWKEAYNIPNTEQTNLEHTNQEQTSNKIEVESNQLGIDATSYKAQVKAEISFSTESNEKVVISEEQKARREFEIAGLNVDEIDSMVSHMQLINQKNQIRNWKAYAKVILKDKESILNKNKQPKVLSVGKKDACQLIAEHIGKRYHQQTGKMSDGLVSLANKALIAYKAQNQIQSDEVLFDATQSLFEECDDWTWENIQSIFNTATV